MISFKKSKSHFLAAIGTVLIHLLLLGALSLQFGNEQSSALSDLDDLQIQMEDMAPEDVQLTPPGKDPLSNQKDKASESISKDKGSAKPQQAAPVVRTQADQQAAAEAIPDTIIPPKPEIAKLLKEDSVKQAAKDSIIQERINKFQKAANRNEAANQRYQKERERFQFYQRNFKNVRNFKKVYPYALRTHEIIENLNKQLATMTDESAKRKLIRETEKMLFQEYESAVRTMTTSQGKLLLKLIARETNKTGYDIIKDYKGGFSASFWYGVGKIFNADLKAEYHKEQEDSIIETIIAKYKDNDLY